MAPTISAAGRMKQLPATISPGHPARWYPTWIAISVEFGPGIRLVAPSRSRNFSRVSQPRRVTISSSIIAMWAAGPPNAIVPSFKNKNASSTRGESLTSGDRAFGASLESGRSLVIRWACGSRLNRRRRGSGKLSEVGKAETCLYVAALFDREFITIFAELLVLDLLQLVIQLVQLPCAECLLPGWKYNRVFSSRVVSIHQHE